MLVNMYVLMNMLTLVNVSTLTVGHTTLIPSASQIWAKFDTGFCIWQVTWGGGLGGGCMQYCALSKCLLRLNLFYSNISPRSCGSASRNDLIRWLRRVEMYRVITINPEYIQPMQRFNRCMGHS